MDACAKVYVKNVRLNVSNSELLLLRKKEEKRNSLSGFPTFSMTFFKVLQSFHPLRLSFQKFGQKKGFWMITKFGSHCVYISFCIDTYVRISNYMKIVIKMLSLDYENMNYNPCYI